MEGDEEALLDTADVGSGPAHVALNSGGTRAYSANQHANSVSVVDVASNETIATVPLSGNGFNLLVSPDGGRVFATTGDGTLHVISAATNTSIEEIEVGAAANGLAYHGRTRTLYVSAREANRITAIDANTLAVKRTYTVGRMPQRIAVAPDASELYIASEVEGLEILDLETGDRTSVSGVDPGAVGLALSPDGVVLYVTNPPARTVTVVDRETRSVLFTIEGEWYPRNVAFDPIGRVAIIADEFDRVFFVR